jgi:hypothetical protein
VLIFDQTWLCKGGRLFIVIGDKDFPDLYSPILLIRALIASSTQIISWRVKGLRLLVSLSF